MSKSGKWRESAKTLKKEFEFADFVSAMGFMQQISYFCESKNHHPEWKNVYNRVSVTLCTHDAGKVTLKDRALAKKMDETYPKFAKK